MARIQFGTLSIPSCPVDKYMEKFLDSEESPELEIELKSCKNLSLTLKKLENGELDLLALPAEILHGKQLEMYNANCEVLGARNPRTPNMILVSENKIQYQPKSAIILSDSKLARRQLRRARKGLRVLSVIAFAEIYDLDLEFDNELSKYSWMEELRLNGDIDGYVIPRVIYSQIDINERRHSLLPDPNNLGDSHFLPQPYSDLVIIIGRKNFPRSISELFTEVEGNTIWKMQDYFLSSIDEKELEGIGILVRHRKLSSLMTQAEKHKDLIMEQSFHDLEGEVITNEILVEFRIEKISNNGKKTISLQRVIPYSKFQIAMVATEKDWKKILDRAEINDFVND